MQQLVFILRLIHISAGTVALICGPLSILNKKGSKQHRLTGKLFFYSMVLVSLAAFILTNLPGRENLFLFLVGIFSLYLVCSGYRILYLKNLYRGKKPMPIDWIITGTMLCFGIFFVIVGGRNVFFLNNYGGWVLTIFGLISLRLVFKDFKNYTQPIADKNFWLFEHITRMMAGTIATFTAFLVVNNRILPDIVAWLLPTVIGSPIIALFIIRYKKELGAGKQAKDLVTVEINKEE